MYSRNQAPNRARIYYGIGRPSNGIKASVDTKPIPEIGRTASQESGAYPTPPPYYSGTMYPSTAEGCGENSPNAEQTQGERQEKTIPPDLPPYVRLPVQTKQLPIRQNTDTDRSAPRSSEENRSGVRSENRQNRRFDELKHIVSELGGNPQDLLLWGMILLLLSQGDDTTALLLLWLVLS